MLRKKAFKKKYYDKEITINRKLTVEVGTQKVQKDVEIYNRVECSFWKRTKNNLANTDLAIDTNEDTYEVNLSNQYTDILIWDTVELYEYWDISLWIFKIEWLLFNKDVSWKIDNIQLYIKSTTNVSKG